jgi:hypothetical protein
MDGPRDHHVEHFNLKLMIMIVIKHDMNIKGLLEQAVGWEGERVGW